MTLPRTTSTIAMLGLAALAAAGPCRAQIPPALPTGFSLDILTTGVVLPTGFAFLPDGRVVISEQKSCAIKVWAGGPAVGTVGVVPGVNVAGYERGLLAIAADPQWPARPYLYAWFNATGTANMRLSMFTITGDVAVPTSTNLSIAGQYDILTDVPDLASIHNGGSLRFGPDGMLYLSIGDDANPCAAQDINSGVGCIIRMDVSALPLATPGPPAKSLLIPPGNPFAGPTDNARLVWAFGLRNPFRFHIDPLTGRLYIGEVGAWLVDEVDECAGGENFGWPWYEANLAGLSCTGLPPVATHPIVSVPHTSLTSATTAVMSGGRYRNVPSGAFNFGPAYEGDYFYFEYFSGALRRLKWNGFSWVPAIQVPGQPTPDIWAVGFQSVVDGAIGPDGAFYFIKQYHAHNAGALGRIRPDPSALVLTKVSGMGQTGNPGLPLIQPFVVRVTTPSGAPVVGANVQFAVVAGGGAVGTPNATTNALGEASSFYLMPSTYLAPPVVAAAVTGGGYVLFDVLWRGLSVVYQGAPFDQLAIEIRHSETQSPFTLTWEPPPASPYAVTPFGDIWTSLFGAIPTAPPTGSLDGLGLFGPPQPQYKTGASQPRWTVVFPNPPSLGGISLVFQAFAIDSTLFPAPQSFMISNAVVVSMP